MSFNNNLEKNQQISRVTIRQLKNYHFSRKRAILKQNTKITIKHVALENNKQTTKQYIEEIFYLNYLQFD